MDIQVLTKAKQASSKKKMKEKFLDSLEERLSEVKLHMEGKIKLKSWDELYKDL